MKNSDFFFFFFFFFFYFNFSEKNALSFSQMFSFESIGMKCDVLSIKNIKKNTWKFCFIHSQKLLV